MSHENKAEFIRALSNSLDNETFVKATIGNCRGKDEHLQRLLVRLIETRKGVRVNILFRYITRDTAKNYSFEEGVSLIGSRLGTEFFSGHLFTTDADFQLDIGKKGKARLNRSRPSFPVLPERSHDRKKKRLVDKESFYLHALGIATVSGEIRSRGQQKWKQINKFVETLSKLFEDAGITRDRKVKVVDMGCGKGYLTFAAYDYFRNSCGFNISVTGVDTRHELIGLCNDIAESSGFSDLGFEEGTIADYPIENVDVLIALHACDTATDDAIYRGIVSKASLIVVSPCCHRELRPQIKPPDMMSEILKHGTLLESQTEIITDGLRALLLERHGYKTKVFEFISVEHTPKNNMIAAMSSEFLPDVPLIEQRIKQLKEEFGIGTQRLETLLSGNFH